MYYIKSNSLKRRDIITLNVFSSVCGVGWSIQVKTAFQILSKTQKQFI